MANGYLIFIIMAGVFASADGTRATPSFASYEEVEVVEEAEVATEDEAAEENDSAANEDEAQEGADPEEDVEAEDEAEESEDAELTQETTRQSSEQVELKRSKDGHFYAEIEINGTPIRAMVDTGASGIALSRADAESAGLSLSGGEAKVVGKGADGDVRGEHVTLDSVSLGQKTAQGVRAVVLSSGEQSLLGQVFLSEFETVEIRGDTMVLR